MATATIHLQRLDTSQPWGFKLQGGSDVGKPLHVAHVSPGSVSGRAGLKIGDVILKIDNVDVSSFTHDDARGEMIRAGNNFNLTIQRDGVPVTPQTDETSPTAQSQVSVSGGGEAYNDVKPKTYQMLEKELPESQATGQPASIFDKNKQKRAEYTKTDKSSYLKTYGAPK
ncbi:hypothetical protein ACJMK2_007263 [Sinanodonta woodiana]|uniref:PDZ domain-containing protein n=1 Tax=Sinanodonta woodiana TaxID=1069815 RepID=A0ABD3VJJ6_SINWO